MAKSSPIQIRLQKVLAERGLCSRREADSWIEDGLVKVNGKVAVPGTKVNPDTDQIVVKGKGLQKGVQTEAIHLVMNKPKGLICSHRDPHHQNTIFDLLPKSLQNKRLLCAGRLDKNSEGLLILTSDGDLANRIMHPSNGVVKRYKVTLTRPLPEAMIPKLLRGKHLDGELLKAEKVILLGKDKQLSDQLEVHLVHGKKREIRRLFESFGYFVKRLHRFQMGKFMLRRLPPGGYRPLSQAEIRSLFD